MKKTILIVLALLLIVGAVYYFMTMENDPAVEEKQETATEQNVESVQEVNLDAPSAEFIQCLVDSGMVVYGSATCPYCKDLADLLGGYDAISSLYVECSEEMERCGTEMKTEYVPEIQINGELYEGSRDLETLAEISACEL